MVSAWQNTRRFWQALNGQTLPCQPSQTSPTLNASQLVKDYLTTHSCDRSIAKCLRCCFDQSAHLNPIMRVLFTGGISSCSVCAEVLRCALKYGASQSIIAHNHPNTSATASQADLEITRSLAKRVSLSI